MHFPRLLSEFVVKRPRTTLYESWCPLWIATTFSSRCLVPSWISQGWPGPHMGQPSPDSFSHSPNHLFHQKFLQWQRCSVCELSNSHMCLPSIWNGLTALGELEEGNGRTARSPLLGCTYHLTSTGKRDFGTSVWIASMGTASQLLFC